MQFLDEILSEVILLVLLLEPREITAPGQRGGHTTARDGDHSYPIASCPAYPGAFRCASLVSMAQRSGEAEESRGQKIDARDPPELGWIEEIEQVEQLANVIVQRCTRHQDAVCCVELAEAVENEGIVRLD
jgi:hypothetical protein